MHPESLLPFYIFGLFFYLIMTYIHVFNRNLYNSSFISYVQLYISTSMQPDNIIILPKKESLIVTDKAYVFIPYPLYSHYTSDFSFHDSIL